MEQLCLCDSGSRKTLIPCSPITSHHSTSHHRPEAHTLGSNDLIRTDRTSFISHLCPSLASVCFSVRWHEHDHSRTDAGLDEMSQVAFLDSLSSAANRLGMAMGDLPCLPGPDFPHLQKVNYRGIPRWSSG